MNVDPWRDCRRRFDQHFTDRMTDRSLPKYQVERALLEGTKRPLSAHEFRTGQDYEILWKDWVLKTTLGRCVVILWTAYLT